jgi:hypothetical protein
MKWIEVNEDLPPNTVRVLVHCQFKEDGVFTICDAYFEPGQGWYSHGYDQHIFKVYQWHPLATEPKRPNIEEESIQRSLAVFRAACAKLDDSLGNPPSSSLGGS